MALYRRVGTRSRRAFTLLGIAVVALIGALWQHTQPASAYDVFMNDNFSGASVLPGNAGSTHEFTGGASKQVGDPATAGSRSVWFKWTPTTTGTAKFTTRGSECVNNV